MRAPGKRPGALRRLFFSLEAWRSRRLAEAILLGLIIGLTSFWNGAAVIGGLLILAGMAVFSKGKLDYLIMAVIAVIFTLLQTRFFIYGTAFSPQVVVGFLADQKTLPGILWYLLQISGLGILGLVLALPLLGRRGRELYLGCLLPCAFAFLFSLTPDIGVNHKYIMISMAFCSLLWGGALERLWKKGIPTRLLALVLAFFLMATGAYDFVVILKDNDAGHRFTYPLEGEVTRWFADHTTEEDLILSPLYSTSEVTLSGAMLYNGWPYYAWSAGYDTYTRGEIQREIYTTKRAEKVLKLCWQEGITYIVYENGMELDGESTREESIAEACGTPVFDNGYLRVYQVP